MTKKAGSFVGEIAGGGKSCGEKFELRQVCKGNTFQKLLSKMCDFYGNIARESEFWPFIGTPL